MSGKVELLETRPLDAGAWCRLAASCVAEQRIPDAIDAIGRALHLTTPKAGEMVYEISQVLESLAAHPEAFSLQLRAAKTCAFAGLLDRAILHLEKALEHDGENIEAHHELAELYWRRARQEESIDTLNRLLWLRPDDVEAGLVLAERLIELQREKSAMMIVRRISDKVPPTGEGELRIGRLLRQCGSAEAALWRLEKAVVLLADSAHAHFEVALAYLDTGRTAAAIDELLETHRLRPDWNDPLRRLAQLHRELGLQEQAEQFEQLLQDRPLTLDLDDITIVEDDDFSEHTELSGRLRLMPVAELLQFLAQRMLTGILRVSSENGAGAIEIYRGTVVGANLDGSGPLEGTDVDSCFLRCQSVIGEMIGWTDGQIDFVAGETYEAEPSIRFEVPHLLLETMRKMDEASA